MARSPSSISGWSAPHDPTRMKVGRSVIARISATTISTLSVPMPVETTDTRWPRNRPVTEANSRCRCSSSMDSKREAMRAVRSGSPGRRMYSASSPGPSPMWYCRSPAGIAIRRSEGFSTRGSAFGKTASSLRWLLRWRETRPRIVPRSHERQAEWIVLDPRSADARRRRPSGRVSGGGRERGQSTGDPGGQTPPAGGPSEERHGHRCGRDRGQRAQAGGPGVERQRAAQAGEPTGRATERPGRAGRGRGRSGRRLG